MSKIYMAVTVCQDRNESIFKPRENAEYSPGYYSYVLPCKAGENLKFALDCVNDCVAVGGDVLPGWLSPAQVRLGKALGLLNEALRDGGEL